MSYVPKYHDKRYEPSPSTAYLSITVAALRENKRPVGFAPWPEEPAPRAKDKRKKKKT